MALESVTTPAWHKGMGSKRGFSSRRQQHRENPSNMVILQLAFQSIGIVFGDLGTSPLYVLSSVFPNGIKHNDDMLAVFGIIFYTLTLLPLVKYVMIVLRATDNGEGGTFALYSLVCRYAKIGLIPNQQEEDAEVSTYHIDLLNSSEKIASKLKTTLENSHFMKLTLLFATLLGTSMVIGDGILTPCISVLSAVGGIKEAASDITQTTIIWVSVAILFFLFMIQRFGTDKIGYSFSPILSIWFFSIAGIGVYNFIKYDPSIIKALYPKYIVDYFVRNKKEAWISLGGVVLCTTGTEALFADVGHFTVRSIQISTCFMIYPAVICNYAGQISYLRKHPESVANAFYSSIPVKLYWPMFVVAVLSAIIASQAMISGSFSMIQQSLSMGCFPRVQVVHTSTKHEGQVYIPEVNYLLMILSIILTIAFKDTTTIGNAYGIAVVFVMTLTSTFMVLIMVMIWKTNIVLVILYVLIIGSVELIYLSSVLCKFVEGGYLPLAFAAVLTSIMLIWHNVYRRMHAYELSHKISSEKLKEISTGQQMCKLPGVAIFYSGIVHDIPPIFNHYVTNVPALHSMIIFVTVKSLHISKVPYEERFLFRRIPANDVNAFRCVVRYGYTDMHREQEDEPFEKLLVERMKDFIADEFWLSRNTNKSGRLNDSATQELLDREVEMIDKASSYGITHFMGANDVVSKKGSNIAKRVMINYAYTFLKKNLRQSEKLFHIPQERLLKIGMTYQL